MTLRVMSIRRMDCDHGKPPGTEHDRRLSMRTSPPTKAPKPLLSVEEAANLLGETRSTLYRSIKEGSFPLPNFQDWSKDPHSAAFRGETAGRTAGDLARGTPADYLPSEYVDAGLSPAPRTAVPAAPEDSISPT